MRPVAGRLVCRSDTIPKASGSASSGWAGSVHASGPRQGLRHGTGRLEPEPDRRSRRRRGCQTGSKEELFATSDVISLHLVLSDRSRGIVGRSEIDAMKRARSCDHTSRGPLVDTAALVAALDAGRIRAGIDTFDDEPLPADHPLRRTPNTVLTPHLGYVAEPVMRIFYGDSVGEHHGLA